uniref:Helicase C-terminal domain-containing protein n=1 Tax=viral metagenome TaxID=1070528 RepID=A0A6C0DRU4_9ZZZZ
MSSAGPPKFARLKRTAVRFDANIAPTEANVTEDFTQIAPLTFDGAAAKAVPVVVASEAVQAARIADAELRDEALTGPKPAAEPQPTVAKPPSRKRAAPSMFEPAAPVVEGEAVAKAVEAAAEVAAAPVVLGRVEDAEQSAALKPADAELMQHVTEAVTGPPRPPMVKPAFYVPENRRGFKPFVIQTFKQYILPPLTEDPDPETCTKAAKASTKELKTFQYQAFVRDYLQRASPYRGLLVYHGLGSGKTCTSIATAEALYGAGNRKIIIMTPASLSGNYRGELTKCGYFAFQQENYWTFLAASVKPVTAELTFLTDTIGLPINWIKKNGGAWVPDPTLPSNWEVLSAAEKATITKQIQSHIEARFTFINYNGLTEKRVRDWACKTPTMFDGSVVIIDEVHNLIRTINNSRLEEFYKTEPLEPEYKAKFCMTGKRYRISYLVYRLLCNAVGTKIVALSGTPIINYPQELGIMANLLAGDMRYASGMLSPRIDVEAVKTALAKHPEVDIYEILPGKGAVSMRLTPVPSGYRKVVDPATGVARGFVRNEDGAAGTDEISRERDLTAWMNRVEMDLRPLVKARGTVFNSITYGINQRLPDIEKPFVDTFINKETLTLNSPNDLVLMARLSGLISYYKAGKVELVARVEKDEVVQVEMSDRQLQQYTIVRQTEIKQEERDRKGKQKAPAPRAPGARYDEVLKAQKGTFKIFSRACCNFVFPEDIARPRPGDEAAALADLGHAVSGDSQGGDIMAEGEQELVEEPVAEAPVPVPARPRRKGAAEAAPVAVADPYQEAIRAALASLRAKGAAVFAADKLPIYSPKFQAIIDRLETAKGPALLYSQFKTLEGLGIFGMALELQKNYIKFDIQLQASGNWALSPELLIPENADKKRYITYTGDEKAEKRDLLKHIFNANWTKMPAELATAIRNLAGAENNISGKIAQVFMITQSGAEGISLENVRQVHLMEPYWNYVRLEQVKGRAIRICSHKSLPFDERTVEVFTYISKFGAAQKKERRVDETLLIKDGGETTDQSILSVANDKKKLADSLFEAMKRAAVDCELNATENGVAACYRFDTNPTGPLFHPDLTQDISSSGASVRRA